MKYLITLFFACSCVIALSQQKTTQTHSHIDNDGNLLKIKIFAVTDKATIDYNKEFNVRGMPQEQVDMMVDHIMDSLGLPRNNSSKKEKTWRGPSSLTQPLADKELWDIAEKFNAQQVEQFNKGNMLEVARFYSDEAIIYHPGKIYQGREAINKYWQDIKDAKNWKLTIKEVGGSKKSFWVAGLSELTVVNNNVEKTFASNYIVIMQPDKTGEYKIYKDIYNQASNK